MSTYPIRTVVVLVQENRSFDHIIGWMKSLNPEINGVTGSESNPISTSNPNSDFIYFGDRSENVDPDPGHSFQAIYVQVFGEEFSINSSIDEWICAAGGEDSERNVGDSDEYGFRPDALPVYKELVSEFAVFDRWFALVPAYTQPNWLFMHSATSHGATSNDIEKLMEGYPQKTIFDSLDEDGFSFGIYYKLLPPTLFIQVARGESSHFIFEGPPGVGKRTMAMAFLRGVFGPENLETRDEMKEFELKGEAVARIEVKVKLSPQHIELNLPDLYGYEQHILIELLIDNSNCQAIVLHKADKLSADAQHYIRWIVERYKSCSKIFFCCSDVSKLQPIKSICTLIELLPPSNHEIIEVLDYIAEQESIELPSGLAERITKKSKQNLRQAIRSFEASWKLSYSFKEDQVILTGWEDDIANTAKNIIKEQSPKQLYIIRGKLQNLIEHNVSPEFIFDVLVEELKKHLDDYFKPKVDALYLEYNDSRFPLEDDKSLPQRGQEQPGKRHNDPIRKNANDFMKIEEFIAKFMSLYKTRVKNYGGSNSPEK